MELEIEPDLTANIDLDGTVADFNGAMLAGLESMRSPSEPMLLGDDPFRDPPEWLDARMMYIKNRPGFWRNLTPIPLGMQVLDLIREAGFTLNVLTKGPKRTTGAWTEKVEWSNEHIPDAEITVTQNKSRVYGRVLFDDWPPYIKGWLQRRPRGLVLMLDHTWNKDFTHPNVLRVKSSTDFPAVQAALALRIAA